jgi:hypothetical protein
MRKAVQIFISLVAAASFTGAAYANEVLTLSDNNGHSKTLTDSTGILTFIGSIGDWNINVTTGFASGTIYKPKRGQTVKRQDTQSCRLFVLIPVIRLRPYSRGRVSSIAQCAYQSGRFLVDFGGLASPVFHWTPLVRDRLGI